MNQQETEITYIIIKKYTFPRMATMTLLCVWLVGTVALLGQA